MKKTAKIFVAGYQGLRGSPLVRKLGTKRLHRDPHPHPCRTRPEQPVRHRCLFRAENARIRLFGSVQGQRLPCKNCHLTQASSLNRAPRMPLYLGEMSVDEMATAANRLAASLNQGAQRST